MNLLNEIYVWEKMYREKLIKKKPLLPENEVNDTVTIASDRKFREKFNDVLKIKIKKISYLRKLSEEISQ